MKWDKHVVCLVYDVRTEVSAGIIIDHQVGFSLESETIPVAELKHNVVALAKAAKVLGVPTVVTATSPEMWGPVIPELTEALSGISIINRTTVNAFDEPRFAKAVEATGRNFMSQMRLVLLGASGMLGGHALRYIFDHPTIERVTAIGRRKLGVSHPKLHEVLHQDFSDCSALAQTVTGQDACVFCLGTYTGTVRDAELRTVTVDYTIEFARVLHGSSPDATFAFLSGGGADQTGRSRLAYARYKGEAEKALLAAGFPSVYIFRPAYIYPVEPRKEPNFSYRLLRMIYPVFRALFPNQVIRADDLARAMVDVTIRRRGERGERGGFVFENRDIRAMVESSVKSRRADPSVSTGSDRAK